MAEYANPFAEDHDTAAIFDAFDDPKPKKRRRIEPDNDDSDKAVTDAMKAAEHVADRKGFSRRAKTKTRIRRSAMYETGRSRQISVKGRDEDFDRLAKLCDAQDWVKGQALQYALDALELMLEEPEGAFWKDRNLHGVD